MKLVDRSAFTIDPNRRYENRPDQQGHTYFEDEQDEVDSRVRSSMPTRPGRPNIVNGKKMSLPPGLPSMPRADRNRHELRAERRDFQKEAEEARRSQRQPRSGGIDFGDLNGMDGREEGEHDDDEEDFASRLNRNGTESGGKASKPGARDRRAQKQAESQRGGRTGGSFQPFKNFKEPGRRLGSGGDSVSERGSVRSRSTSPHGRDYRRGQHGHQPPPPPLPDRPRQTLSLADRLDPNGRDRHRGRDRDRDRDVDYGNGAPLRRRSRSPQDRQSSGKDNLLDRIQSARNDRDYPRGRGGRNDDLARGDDFVSLLGHHREVRESRDTPGSRKDDDRRGHGQSDRYQGRGERVGRGQAKPYFGGRYRGGYV